MGKVIDLGRKDTISESVPSKPEKAKTYYPSIYIRDIEGLDSLPKGKFKFTGEAQVTSSTVTNRDGNKTVSCEIEIHTLQPIGSAPKAKTAADGLKEALDSAYGDDEQAESDMGMTDDENAEV